MMKITCAAVEKKKENTRLGVLSPVCLFVYLLFRQAMSVSLISVMAVASLDCCAPAYKTKSEFEGISWGINKLASDNSAATLPSLAAAVAIIWINGSGITSPVMYMDKKEASLIPIYHRKTAGTSRYPRDWHKFIRAVNNTDNKESTEFELFVKGNYA